MSSEIKSGCPICFKLYPVEQIETHVDKCLFLNSQESAQNSGKRYSETTDSPSKKKRLIEDSGASGSKAPAKPTGIHGESRVPLAETMRPISFADFIGQDHVLAEGKTLRQLISNHRVPSMILWGPPGCGKTTLAHIIHKMSRESADARFVKLTCTSAGVNDVKEVVQCAKNELNSFKRSTLLFMDEIHRFNKLQQDVFLPHIESGLITLIGATTENPSVSLNNALLSRCRVIVLEKLTSENVIKILKRAVTHLKGLILSEDSEEELDADSVAQVQFSIESEAIQWLADMCDGDARIALNSLQMALESASESKSSHLILKLSHIKDGLKKSHLLHDKKGEEHYNLISALHKSIRASDDNAALYWLVRMLEGGEDPVYIARRLVRAAAEDVGLTDPLAMTLAVSAMQGCQMIGMPECDILLAQVTTYLARTHKSREINDALSEARRHIRSHRGPLPGVPLHLRNANSKLTRELGYGKGYNMREKDSSNLTYMPPGMESVSFFKVLSNNSNQDDF